MYGFRKDIQCMDQQAAREDRYMADYRGDRRGNGLQGNRCQRKGGHGEGHEGHIREILQWLKDQEYHFACNSVIQARFRQESIMGYIPRSQLVYHAGLMPVPHPDITLSSSRTDFGKGFYVTHNIEQAYNWGMKKVMKEIEYATMQKTVPFTKEFVVSQYVMLSQKGIEKSGFKTKAFSEPGPEWAEMIFNCRVRKDRPPFDIITGPVADDDISHRPTV